MDHVTFTATGKLDLTTKSIDLSIGIPNPPKPDTYLINYYNLSKLSAISGKIMNVILCEFTFKDDDGSILPTPTSNTYDVSLFFDDITKAPGVTGVQDFDLNPGAECLFLCFHSTDANSYDRESFFEVMEQLYDEAPKFPYAIYPAPLMKTAPTPTGKPRLLGSSPPIK